MALHSHQDRGGADLVRIEQEPELTADLRITLRIGAVWRQHAREV
jgi:hypothetical protein